MPPQKTNLASNNTITFSRLIKTGQKSLFCAPIDAIRQLFLVSCVIIFTSYLISASNNSLFLEIPDIQRGAAAPSLFLLFWCEGQERNHSSPLANSVSLCFAQFRNSSGKNLPSFSYIFFQTIYLYSLFLQLYLPKIAYSLRERLLSLRKISSLLCSHLKGL